MEPAPIYRPPSEPGKPVADPAIWTGQGLAADASWQLPLSDGAPKDIKFLAAHIRPRGADDPRKLLTLTHADLPIGLLAQTRDALGLAVIRGLSVQGWNRLDLMIVCWAMGRVLGVRIPITGRGT